MNLAHQAPRGIWILYPILGGTFSGGAKKHHYTPIAKYYTFNQCGGNVMMIKENHQQSSISLSSSQRQSDNIRDLPHPLVSPYYPLIIQPIVIPAAAIRVDGGWGPWSGWSSCSLSCGNGGNKNRFRTCDNPRPMGLGRVCAGSSHQTKSCIINERCPDFGRQMFVKMDP